MYERCDPNLDPDISALLARSDVIFSRIKDYGEMSPEDIQQLISEIKDLARDSMMGGQTALDTNRGIEQTQMLIGGLRTLIENSSQAIAHLREHLKRSREESEKAAPQLSP